MRKSILEGFRARGHHHKGKQFLHSEGAGKEEQKSRQERGRWLWWLGDWRAKPSKKKQKKKSKKKKHRKKQPPTTKNNTTKPPKTQKKNNTKTTRKNMACNKQKIEEK